MKYDFMSIHTTFFSFFCFFWVLLRQAIQLQFMGEGWLESNPYIHYRG